MAGNYPITGEDRKLASVSTQIERLDENKVKFDITVSKEEVASYFKSTYREVAKKNRVPGFRPGKAPRSVLDTTFGKDYFVAQATDAIVNAYYPTVVDDENFISFGDPEMEINELAKEGEDYSFTFTVEVKPEFELSDYEPVAIELESTEASEAEIDEQIETFRNYYMTYEVVEAKRGLKKGDVAQLALECSSDGEPIPSMTTDIEPYEVGKGDMPDSFDEGITGMKADETREFDFDVKNDSLGVLASSGTIHCKAALHAISKKVLPEVTDEWVKTTLSYESVAELRERLATMVSSRKQSMQEQQKSFLMLEKLAERLQGEPSENVIAEAERKNYQDFFQALQRQGATLDVYLQQMGITPEQYRKDMHEQAILAARENLALDAVVRHFALEATDEEIADAFREAALDPEISIKEWREQGRLAYLREGFSRDKAAKWLQENAKIEIVDPKKKPAEKKSAAKKVAAKVEGEAAEETSAPAPKKAATKKASTKKNTTSEEENK